MRITLCLSFLLSAALATNIKMNPLSDEFINHINSQQNDWKAGRNFDENMPISEIKKRMGARKSISKAKPTVHSKDIEIPESFDARTNWPECSSVIGSIADQSACGSCWAVSTTSAMSDRRCIASGGSLQVPVSAEDVLTCCTDTSCWLGCDGGSTQAAWNYWFQSGIVTGGRYNSSLGCKPYPFQPCDNWLEGKYVQCSTLSYDTPDCTRSCSSSGLNYRSELTYGKSMAEKFATVEDVQREILQNGPVTASFVLYEDFVNYKSGVYHYVDGDEIGGHSVRIIGWGVENNVAYWLVANSWNEDWGDDGLFKIRRGVDECSFEMEINAAQAKV
ncbi:unnamed protein product [Psylliodes chrysocephalus]|uniref:Peptidase C1A papain C-terminal domain-containing protein n=1 Tax=Psylliodes chrysocephalus TaxID=3402493 RepID=A0A9P0CMR3_9CUCU|nr:unnamed protein product [Psylliodes chrysocephala]